MFRIIIIISIRPKSIFKKRSFKVKVLSQIKGGSNMDPMLRGSLITKVNITLEIRIPSLRSLDHKIETHINLILIQADNHQEWLLRAQVALDYLQVYHQGSKLLLALLILSLILSREIRKQGRNIQESLKSQPVSPLQAQGGTQTIWFT